MFLELHSNNHQRPSFQRLVDVSRAYGSRSSERFQKIVVVGGLSFYYVIMTPVMFSAFEPSCNFI